MDPSFNEFIQYDEDIRPPDEVKREQLIEDTRSEFQKQMDEALSLSLQEAKQQQEISLQYEEEIIKNYHFELNKRKEAFKQLLFDLNKLIKFDKDIKEIYEIIEPIIESYCSQYIEYTALDSITYDKIFKVIGAIRTNKNNIELLKTILIKQ
jgi:hypothetical protein